MVILKFFVTFADMIQTCQNYDLSARNTFALAVKCKRWVEYDSADDLPLVVGSMTAGEKWVHIGAGSNMLFLGDYDGTVVHSAVRGIDFTDADGCVLVRACSGEPMDAVVAECCRRNLWGLENLSGIPGEAGASAVQNVGAYGVEAADVIESIEAFDCERMQAVVFDPSVCGYAYRDSMFKHSPAKGRYIITAVTYRLTAEPAPHTDYPALRDLLPHTPASPAEVRAAVIAIRDSKLPDPSRVPSAGSFFKNPVVSREAYEQVCAAAGADVKVPCYETDDGVKIPAAWLIDRCGWKGTVMGNAAVWHLQPLVLTNPERKATPDEIVKLEAAIAATVRERFGVELTPEVEHV